MKSKFVPCSNFESCHKKIMLIGEQNHVFVYCSNKKNPDGSFTAVCGSQDGKGK